MRGVSHHMSLCAGPVAFTMRKPGTAMDVPVEVVR